MKFSISIIFVISLHSCSDELSGISSFKNSQSVTSPEAVEVGNEEVVETSVDTVAFGTGTESTLEEKEVLNGGEGELSLALRCAGDDVQETTQTITFPAITSTCPWNSNGNSSQDSSAPAARAEQTANIVLPAYIEDVCATELVSSSGQLTYDDAIIFSLNDLVMASNGFSDGHFDSILLKSEGGLPIYDFSRLIHRGYQKHVNRCAEGVECSIPQSETSGQVSIAVSSDWFEKSKLFSEEGQADALTMRLAVTGNKQASDCRHSGISFTFKLKYR
ncbi:hypothetical protein N9D31_02080 [Oligoflexaceae bacterium]|nr:hypothetical protein [Oligoflexaceae bacterium]